MQHALASKPDWEANFGQAYEQDKRKFEDEIKQLRQGYEFIRDEADVRFAFMLTNETFRRLGEHPNLIESKSKTAWRLFQIVFLVSQIPGIIALRDPQNANQAEREKVDIIYFPTGGGKTEAYLGTLVFHCFFDRLRGKSAGVTAWTRFPLRLLTLQQTQRMADVIGVADLIRREQTDGRLSGKVAGFSIGYFVGKEATPNEICDPSKRGNYSSYEEQTTWSQANDTKVRQNWKRVVTCPSCRTNTVQIDFDFDKVRVFHHCTNNNCAFPNGTIPVYVVDNEIYRYLPSVIVGTIDKLASLGNQRKMAQMFGVVDGKCETHGYYKGKCCQKDCTDKKLLKKQIPKGLSGPTLFIQDELHLLKEGLGTFDGHYETFTQELRRSFGQKDVLKIIASSATIEKFERQVEHLYGRKQEQARLFPGFGPTLRESFYAQTREYPQRIYVGLLPHNKTIFNTILELIELYHRLIQSLQKLPKGDLNPYGGNIVVGTDRWFDLLDPYITSLTYFLANRELDSIRTDLFGDVIPRLKRDGYEEIIPKDMTGNISTDEVTQNLELFEKAQSKGQAAHAILATQMISHGVDIDRLNAMIFYGMPRQTAEYIQASSRVGRSHVGIIFSCLHPARERDQSHYTYFAKYHEFLGQLVEPVAINRWAKFSINRTLPGLFMAVLLQILSNEDAEKGGSYYMADFVSKKISDSTISSARFISLLEQAYQVTKGSHIAEGDFREQINKRVARLFDYITSPQGGKFVSDRLIPKPMISLRDVDEAVEIELDSIGSQWASSKAK